MASWHFFLFTTLLFSEHNRSKKYTFTLLFPLLCSSFAAESQLGPFIPLPPSLFLGGGATFVPKKVIAPSSLPFPPKRPESVPHPPQNPDSSQRKRRRELKVEIPLGGGPLWRKIGRRRREENGLGLVYSFPRFFPTSTIE